MTTEELKRKRLTELYHETVNSLTRILRTPEYDPNSLKIYYQLTDQEYNDCFSVQALSDKEYYGRLITMHDFSQKIKTYFNL